MNDVLRVARTHVLTAVRERITLFWFLIFPLLLLVLLSAIFGQIGRSGGMQFAVSLVDLDRGEERAFSDLVVRLFQTLASNEEASGEPLFALSLPGEDEDPTAFLETAREELLRGRRAAVVILPNGFGEAVLAGLGGASATPDAELRVLYAAGNAASEMARSIVLQVLARVDREILERAGRLDATTTVRTETSWVGGAGEQASYIDFLLPGIVLMGLFVNGLFGIPGSILFARERRILRRYWVTPLGVPRFLAGLSIGHVALCVVQFALLYAVGRFALGATVSFADAATVGLLVLAAATFMALGFVIASLAKTGNAGMAVANALNMPIMFLSGLFFPISGLPAALRVIVYINPASYLAAGLRARLGVDAATFPTALIVLVPLAWVAVAAVLVAVRMRWDVER